MKWREWTERRMEFEAKLKAEFPILYKGLGIHWREGGMLDGITVGPGWWNIVHQLSKKLSELAAQDPSLTVMAVQVKEKLACLTYYVSPYVETADLLIGEAAKESRETCEYCGAKPATVSDYHPWLKTLCARCHEERKASG